MICRMAVRKDHQTGAAIAEPVGEENPPVARLWKLYGPGWQAEGRFLASSDALRAAVLVCETMGWLAVNPRERMAVEPMP